MFLNIIDIMPSGVRDQTVLRFATDILPLWGKGENLFLPDIFY
jgi:hypothetical protein